MATSKNISTPLIITGYVLYCMLIIAVLLSTTIPFGMLLSNPHVVVPNVIVSMTALTVGALLPALIGYIAGSKQTKSTSKVSHHFNGMLFGLLAFWLAQLMSMYLTVPVAMYANHLLGIVAVNVLPSVGVIALIAALAVLHRGSKYAKKDVIEYVPFAITLIATVMLVTLLPTVTALVNETFSLALALPAVFIVFSYGLAYLSILKVRMAGLLRATWAAVAASVLVFAVYVVTLLESSVSVYINPRPTELTQTVEGILSLIFVLSIWLLYWIVQRRRLVANARKRRASHA